MFVDCAFFLFKPLISLTMCLCFREDLVARLDAVVQTRTRAEWRAHFNTVGCSFSHAPINTVTEAFELPQVSEELAGSYPDGIAIMTLLPVGFPPFLLVPFPTSTAV